MQGNPIYGVSINDAFNAIRQTKGEPPIDLNAAFRAGIQSSSEPTDDAVKVEEETEKQKEEREREERREEILKEMRTIRRTEFLI
jgi:hypothetical protein